MNQTLRKEVENKVPVKVEEVLNEYFKKVDERLSNLLESFYLFGSVSLGAYQDGMSYTKLVITECNKLHN